MREKEIAMQCRHTERGSALRNVVLLLAVLAAGGGAYYFFGRSTEGGLFAEGQTAWKRGDFESAAPLLERAVEQSPGEPMPKFLAALSLIQIREMDRAAGYLAALSTNPEWKTRAHYHKVLGYLRAKRPNDAKKVVDQENTKLKNSPVAREAQGLYNLELAATAETDAVKILAELTETPRANSYQDRLRRIIYADSAIYERSVEQLFERLKDQEKLGDSGELRAVIDRGHQHLINAVIAFDEALKATKGSKEPDPQRSRFELAIIYSTRGRTQEAEELFRQVIDMQITALRDDPYFLEKRDGMVMQSRRNLAEFMIKSRRYAKAIEYLSAVDENKDGLRPYDVDFTLAECYEAMGKPEKMLEIVDAWLQKDASVYGMNYLKGKELMRRGKTKDAMFYLERARSRRQSNDEYTRTLVDCYLKNERWQSADYLASVLLDSEPRDERHHIVKAQALEGLGYPDDAAQFLVRSIRRYFSDKATAAHRTLRKYLDELMLRNDLLPKTLAEAQRRYEADPDNFRVAERYVTLLVEAQNLRTAAAIIDVVRSACPPDHPQYADVMRAAANLAMAQLKYDEAANIFGLVTKIRPTSVAAHLGQAQCYVKIQDIGRALDSLEKAELLDPGNLDAARIRFDLHTTEADWSEAAKVGEILVAAEPKNGSLLKSVAGAYIRSGQTPQAMKMLDRLRSIALSDEDAIEYGDLLLDAGRAQEGERQLLRVVEDDPGDSKRTLAVGKALFRNKRYDAVIRGLEPIAKATPETSAEILKLIAQSQRRTGNTTAMLDTLAVLRNIGERAWVYEWMTDICREDGRFEEALSIIDAAKTEKLETPEMAVQAIKTALTMKDLERAKEYARQIENDADKSSVAEIIALAEAYAAERNVARVISILENAREGAGQDEIRQLIAAQLRLLGEGNWIDRMLEVATQASRLLPSTTGLPQIVVEQLMASDRPEAIEVVQAALATEGELARLRLDRALILLRNGEQGAAFGDFSAAFKLERSPETAHALVLLATHVGKKDVADGIMKAKGAEAVALLPGTIAGAQFLASLGGPAEARIAATANLGFRSKGEMIAFSAAVESMIATATELEVVRDALASWLIFREYPRTQLAAVRTLQSLIEKHPEHARAFTLAAARIEMSNPSTFTAGVQRITDLLKNGDDEAGYLIYAEHYVRTRDFAALRPLTEYVVASKAFGPDFIREFSALLIEGGLPQDAARVLYVSPETSPEKDALLASALFFSGNVGRAAQLVSLTAGRPTTSIGAQILAEAQSQTAGGLDGAITLASDAVYKLPNPHPSAYLTLARVASKRGMTEEAQKNITRYVAQTPTSARSVDAALGVIRDAGDTFAELREWLEERRELVDPSHQIKVAR